MLEADHNQAIRVLFLSDTHLGLDCPQKPRINRRRRCEEFFENYHLALEAARQRQVDFLVHGGDLFFRSPVPPALVSRAFQPLLQLADEGIPIFLVPGNHERSRLTLSLFEQHPDIHIFDRCRTFFLAKADLTVSISGFPFIRHGIREKFRSLIDETGWNRRPAAIRILCIHQAVEGAQVGAHNYVFRSGEQVIRGQDIPEPFQAVLCGHIHKHQLLTRDLDKRPLHAPVFMPGACTRTSFAERLEDKGFEVLSIGLRASEEFHRLPSRPMVYLTVNGAQLSGPRAENYLRQRLGSVGPDSIVRLEIQGSMGSQAAALVSQKNLRSMVDSTINIELRRPFNNRR